MSQAVIALGSNIGDSLNNMKTAINYLEEYGCLVLKKSKVYQTEPWGYKDQADFLNAAVLVETIVGPRGLLEITQGIEKKMGRNKEFLNGPRNIDLDILVYEDEEVTEDDLTVPHARLHQRLFVLKPMADVAPQWQVGDLGTVVELLAAYEKSERVELTELSL
ncbi:MAG: 2-amino-4-hydroxy-6-hydroxymethyldihydropteridine diphosphokinase [Bacillota bacterium]|nr:2-amino-4-hydroxy-6-hydroxymethyldihydropteridine diphosphokinase [Bacillota bacterium]